MSDGAESATLILFSGELDKAMAAFIVATGAASMGMQTTVFFTFWGLNCLRRGGTGEAGKASALPAKSPVGRMLDVMNPGGLGKLPLSRLDMLGAGRKMMKSVMQKKGIASLPELMEMARELGVRLVACQMSMDALEIRRDEFVFPEIEVGGVATFLAAAGESRFTLFI
ncbi:MAG: DsrE/DsrF/DrsH-like family protein [Thermodesulfobacteriota bacterium]|jgi:peroxiredoxin family protein